MKRNFALLLALLAVVSALLGCHPAPGEELPPDTSLEDSVYVTPNGNFTLKIGDPVVVYQGEEGDQGWGKYQFPELRYTVNGNIQARWSYGQDYVGAEGNLHLYSLSRDEGATWSYENEERLPTIPMENGKYYVNVHGRGTVKTTEVDFSYAEPLWVGKDGSRLYRAEDLRGAEGAETLFVISFYEYDPATGTTTEFESRVDWPGAPVKVYPHNVAYTISGLFDLSGANVFPMADGSLYFVIYGCGLNSEAGEGEDPVLPNFNGESSVYVFRSDDSARSWQFLSQISPDFRVKSASRDFKDFTSDYEGFTEPKMLELPNGHLLMLLRTGMTRTMFCCLSEDGGRSWSEPLPFDDFGVLPQLLTLPCGVTLASYGRPALRVRATSDPLAAQWEKPVTIPLSRFTMEDDGMQGRTRGCFYTNLLPLNDTEALLAYTDFWYPNENGVGVRTILVRRLTVIPEGAEGAN